MTPQMILTMIVLGFAIVLFIFEWVRVDVVGIIMMALLPLIGLVSPKEAFVGLSSNAVVSIMAVIIIGAGLDKTGVMNKVAGPIVKLAGNSEKKVITLISGTVGIISSMMQNIGAAALFLPAAQRIGKRMGVPVSRILMPMGFCAIIGGTITLVGASPTILLNDLMVLGGKKLEPFGLFTQTPIGICLLASAIIYFLIFGKFVLPAAEGCQCRVTTPVELLFFQGPHYGDRYGIADFTYQALKNHADLLLATVFSCASVYLVLPEGSAEGVKDRLTAYFNIPG